MKALKRLLAAALVIALLIPITVAGAAYVRGFQDVPEGAWFAESVGYVYDKKMFQGESATSFLPNYTMTRSMFVTVLGRYAGAKDSGTGKGVLTADGVNVRSGPSTSYTTVGKVSRGDVVSVFAEENGWYKIRTGNIQGYVRQDMMKATDTVFSDVMYSTYYSAYIQWAYRNGIISGADKFYPDAPVTREQICVMLYNFCNGIGVTLPQTESRMNFNDAGKITAPDAVYALQQAGIFKGRDDGSFSPDAGASRAEVATILMRFCRLMDSLGADTHLDNTTKTEFDDYVVFGNVLPQSAAVSESHYGDACFVGHSIVNGMSQSFYNTFPSADFLAKDGLSAAGTLSYGEFSFDGRTGTLKEALNAKSYGKVYIMLGINDVGGKTDRFYANMAAVIETVRNAQPNAEIYLISLTPLSKEYTEKRSEAFKVSGLISYNNILQQLSIEKNVYYIDAFSFMADSEGYLLEQYSRDGLHINKAGSAALRTYLDQHTA